jgi:hypothetical protein
MTDIDWEAGITDWETGMRATLLAAAEQFDRYVDYHLAKQPSDREKAATNLAWAVRCREAAKQQQF